MPLSKKLKHLKRAREVIAASRSNSSAVSERSPPQASFDSESSSESEVEEQSLLDNNLDDPEYEKKAFANCV